MVPKIVNRTIPFNIPPSNAEIYLTSNEVDGEGVAAPGVQGEGGPHLPLDKTKNFHSGPSLITCVTSLVKNSTRF